MRMRTTGWEPERLWTRVLEPFDEGIMEKVLGWGAGDVVTWGVERGVKRGLRWWRVKGRWRGMRTRE